MNVLVLLVLLVVIILLLPALSDKIRCGPHRPGPISEIFFPQAELSSQQRLARGWLCIRLCFNTLGVLYILFSILRAFSDVDRWSKISTTHGDFASYIILGCSLLFHGIVFAPCFRSRSARCLGRRARPAPERQARRSAFRLRQLLRHWLGDFWRGRRGWPRLALACSRSCLPRISEAPLLARATPDSCARRIACSHSGGNAFFMHRAAMEHSERD